MPRTLDQLRIEISARTKGLFRELDAAGKRVKRFSAGIQSGLKRAGAAFAATSGASIAFTKVSFANANALQDQADKIGFNVEALQELRFAFAKNGAQQRVVDLGLQRFTRRVAEARKGKGELRAVLEEYNIALTNADGTNRRAADVLGDLADVIANATDEEEKLRIAFKAFDSEGAVLVNTLKQGRDAVKALREESRDLGAVLDAETVKRAAEINSELDALFGAMRTNVQQGILSGFTEEFGDLSELARDEEFQESLRSIGRLIAGISQASIDAAAAIGGFVEKLRSLDKRSTGSIEQQIARMREELEGISPGARGAGAARRRRLQDQIERRRRELERRISVQGQAAAFGAGETKKLAQANETVAVAADEAAAATNRFANAIPRVKPTKTLDDLPEDLKGVPDRMREIAEEAGDLNSQLKDVASNGAARFTDNLTDLLTRAKTAKDAIKDLARSIAVDLAQAFVRTQITSRIVNALPAFFGGGKAGGGRIFGPTLVGERGPEIVTPNRPMTVMNAADSARAMGGVTNVFNIDARGAAVGVGAEIRRALGAAVAEGARQGERRVFRRLKNLGSA